MNISQDSQRGTQEDRLELLRGIFSAALDAAYGAQKMTEQQIRQMMSGMVRAKLFTADDSYKLQDQILDTAQFERTIDRRVEESLRARGIATEAAIAELKERLNRLESQAA